MDNRMDDANQVQNDEKPNNTSTFVVNVGWTCVYCGKQTQDLCCSELHHEIGYTTQDGEIILESELEVQRHIIVDNFDFLP